MKTLRRVVLLLLIAWSGIGWVGGALAQQRDESAAASAASDAMPSRAAASTPDTLPSAADALSDELPPAAEALPVAPADTVEPPPLPPPSSRKTSGSARHSGAGPLGVIASGSAKTPAGETAQALRIVLGLTLLAVGPALLMCLTSFLRIIIVLSMLRHAVGMPETPPNMVLIGLALFLTLFTMSPVFNKVNEEAFQPFMSGRQTMDKAYAKGSAPVREFMVRQTREQDLALMVELSKAKQPQSMDDISNAQLIPAFMLSELRAGFQIGFVIFLPFLLIDLVVASVLMALGMMMMPPTTISLPLKILMFVLVDGWSLVLKSLLGSFH